MLHTVGIFLVVNVQKILDFVYENFEEGQRSSHTQWSEHEITIAVHLAGKGAKIVILTS